MVLRILRDRTDEHKQDMPAGYGPLHTEHDDLLSNPDIGEQLGMSFVGDDQVVAYGTVVW